MDDAFAEMDIRDGSEMPQPTSKSGHRLAWVGLGVLALVVFELTASPALAVALGCLKFGWDELATARWLRRVDPNRLRGRIASRFYAAWALWRVSGVAVALIFITAIVLAPIQQAMQARGARVADVPTEFKTAALVALFGTLATSLTAWIAVATAWWNRIKVWVGPEAKFARRTGHWPPTSIAGRGFLNNRARWVVFAAVGSVVLPIMMGAVFLSILGSVMIGGRGPVGFHWIAALIAVELAFILGTALLVLFISGSVHPRVVARSPEECWHTLDELELPNGLVVT